MAAKRGSRSEVAARWRERLGRWRRTGDSVTEFCLREGISQQSFFQWRRRLAAEQSQPRVKFAARGAAFIPVEVVPDDAANRKRSLRDEPESGAWLEFSRGALLCRVPAEVDELTLRRLVRVLSEEARSC